MSVHIEGRGIYTDLLGWTDEEYAERCAEQTRQQAEREQRITDKGFTCQVKREPTGRTYQRVTPQSGSFTTMQDEGWK